MHSAQRGGIPSWLVEVHVQCFVFVWKYLFGIGGRCSEHLSFFGNFCGDIGGPLWLTWLTIRWWERTMRAWWEHGVVAVQIIPPLEGLIWNPQYFHFWINLVDLCEWLCFPRGQSNTLQIGIWWRCVVVTFCLFGNSILGLICVTFPFWWFLSWHWGSFAVAGWLGCW